MEIEQFIKKRGSVKTKLTLFEKFIAKLELSCPNYKLDDFDMYFELEQRTERFEKLIEDFDNLQLQIEELSDKPEEQYEQRDKFESAFFSALAKSKRFLAVNSTNHSTVVDSETNVKTGQNVNISRDPVGVKLPVIEIAVFKGEYDTWLQFRDTYESLIHTNASLSEIQKFHYLRAYLGSTVLDIIASLEFCSSNYETAWKLICDRFNNSRMLIQNHVKSLFNFSKIRVESAAALRSLIDGVSKHLRALKTLNEPTESWDTLIIYLITTKLDDVTLRKWEQVKASHSSPTLQQMTQFLKERADLLESLEQSVVEHKHSNNRSKGLKNFLAENKSFSKCVVCSRNHYITGCAEFLNLDVNQRFELVKRNRLCINCLKHGHQLQTCTSQSCKTCKGRHHSLLHRARPRPKEEDNIPSKDSEHVSDVSISSGQNNVALSSRNKVNGNHVLLSTVVVNVFDYQNKPHKARALLDMGSQSSFITDRFCSTLNLQKLSTDVRISGLNETVSECTGKCNIRVKSTLNAYTIQVSCLVVPKITGNIPHIAIDKHNLRIPDNIVLADPNFDTPGDIDLLIGAEWFWDIICVGQIKLNNVGPFVHKTKFGWIISGQLHADASPEVRCHLSKEIDVDKQLTRFWEIEEISCSKPLSQEEKLCEQHFQETCVRDINGHFVVNIPLAKDVKLLGDSRSVAEKRFYSLERKLQRNPEFQSMYLKFIEEYKSLGHMSKVDSDSQSNVVYYMPHHGVVKSSSLTTKLRVVFDASCATSSGYSFNDIQLAGPTIQSDLVSILLRFRKHNYVIAADIEKMYRMVFVEPDQRSLQRILWRSSANDPLDTYELSTVTYGTKAASFLAIRCLYQVALENERDHPDVSRVIKQDFYVDDLLTGMNSINETVNLANDISLLLQRYGFHLRKWISNSALVLDGIETPDRGDFVDLGESENTKTLGLVWNGRQDVLSFKINSEFSKSVTKRSVLSEISQIFDPLGLLSPVIILAKIILRDIWVSQLGWDSSLPYHLHTRWLQLRDDLLSLNCLNISRQVTCKDAIKFEIHGFADASAQAYGACVYVKSENDDGESFVNLICAKSKVAPLKTQTIPRLELSAALLCARLVDKVQTSLSILVSKSIYWSDSTIVLGWLRASPSSLQVFVANRVSLIQDLTSPNEWRHVPTLDNPADIVSRGVAPCVLVKHDLYWHGPAWLSLDEVQWPEMPQFSTNELPELRKLNLHSQVDSSDDSIIDFDKYSNLTRLERVIAYCFRFAFSRRIQRTTGPLTLFEIDRASYCIIKISQIQSFGDEMQIISSGRQLKKGSALLNLNPFIDDSGLLRVGGRLAQSDYVYNKKHPIVLSAKHKFTELLFSREHVRLLHAGPQLLLANIRERFWPLAGRNLARKITRNCVRCFRSKPTTVNPLMGDLPSKRINPAPPFFTSGVDYAGPILIRDRQGRGYKTTKAYIALFVCFTTKAVHVELVSDLSTEAFLAALRRFASRRGKPTQIYSDNGTNFVGSNEELGKFLQMNSNILTESATTEQISWFFIPPHSPHFGGLWEAGIKSVKTHLKRIVGNASLTYEKLYTLLVQVEAVLNSRPLHPLSCDPFDYTPLTPSHFLIGRSMMSVPDLSLLDVPTNRLSHFQQVQKLLQHFWNRWSLVYISELQQRTKWLQTQDALKVNDLVLIKDNNLPPLKWALGRIQRLYPGKDGIARVADVRTSKGTVKRSFAKLCPLPVNSDIKT